MLQGDYVLCRLFHKADEKLDNLKYNEVEHSGSLPSPNKSSPDDVSLDLVREPAMMDMQMAKEQEDIKKWWTDHADCLTPTNLAHVESCASDGIDHSGEETPMEVRDEYLNSCWPIFLSLPSILIIKELKSKAFVFSHI